LCQDLQGTIKSKVNTEGLCPKLQFKRVNKVRNQNNDYSDSLTELTGIIKMNDWTRRICSL
jgi:hypothetical protein